jgi:diguanylate cyclase (GGDEF)-like protein/PAS domain S-box-containing protein
MTYAQYYIAISSKALHNNVLMNNANQGMNDSNLLASAANALLSHMCVLDGAGTIVAVNQAWVDFADRNGAHSAGHFVGVNYLAMCDAAVGEDANDSQAMAAGIRAVMRGEKHEFTHDYPCHAPNEQRWFSARVTKFQGNDQHVVVSHVNITRIQQTYIALEIAQNKLLRLQRIYAAITEADKLIDSSSDLNTMFSGVCRIAVDLGGMSMAWVGTPDLAHERVVPLTCYGHGVSYLDGICVSTRSDVPEGRGPTGTAYREKRTVINQDLQADALTQRWRERAMSYGWKSCATFPVCRSNAVIALVVVYSLEMHAFGTEEVELLENLSSNLSQAADALEHAAQRLAIERRTQHSEEPFRTLFETVHQGVVYQNPKGEIMSANPAAERILGLTLTQLRGRASMDPYWQAIHPDGTPFPREAHPAMQAIATQKPVYGVVMGIHGARAETSTWINVTATPIYNKETGVLEYVYSVFDDISDTVRLQHELEVQANRDFLTDVANRRHFFAKANEELARAVRYETPLSLLMLDIDHFKNVNDTYGHAVGDQVLKRVAQVCKDALREVDLLGRIGGEEFAILLPQTPGELAVDVAERIRQAIAQAALCFAPDGKGISITVSLGVSTLARDHADAPPVTADALMQAADTALYQAKNSGRNKVCSAF